MIFSSEVPSEVADVCNAVSHSQPTFLDDLIATRHYGLAVFDPTTTTSRDVKKFLREKATQGAASTREAKRVTLAIVIDGQDLDFASSSSASTVAELAEELKRHPFKIAHFGFSPGFLYLDGLAEKFRLPRRETPRTAISPGSVAIGGNYLGIYSTETPGGWNVIGHTSAQLFDAKRMPPIDLVPGDEVAFQIVDSLPDARPDPSPSPRITPFESNCRGTLRIESLQGVALLEDLGRKMAGYWAVPRAGALDVWAHRRANALVGNREGLATIEFSAARASLEVMSDCILVVTGAVRSISLDGHSIAREQTFFATSGSLCSIVTGDGGNYAYLGVAGGFCTDAIFASASHDVLAHLGSPQLAPGDLLMAGAPQRPPRDHIAAIARSPRVVRVTSGAHRGHFTTGEIDAFFHDEFVVSPLISRVGVRLQGQVLQRRARELAESQPLVTGAIQVPPSGEPIVMLADHPVTGGYPTIAVVTLADLDIIAQARPGDKLRFLAVSREQALLALDARLKAEASILFGYRTYEELRSLGY